MTWNPVRGCSLVSAGCANCYAMKQAHRFSQPGQPYEGLTELGPQGPRWTGKVTLVPDALDDLQAFGPSPEDAVRRRQVRARVRRALRGLPPERRLAAVRHLAGCSVGELMAETGWSYQKARNLVARGVGDLRRTLASN